MKRVQITHIDLDGYGCEFVAKKVFPDIESHNVDYDQFSDKVMEVMENPPDFLLISDIWSDKLSKEAWDALTYFKGELIIFDHHPGKSEEDQNALEVHGATVVNGVGESATLKMAKYYDVDLPSMEIINAYDTSGTIEGDAGKMNALFWEYKSNDQVYYMFDMFARKPFYFNKQDDNLYKQLQERKASYYEEVLKDAELFTHGDVNCAFVEVENHHAYVAKQLLTFTDLAILYNTDRPKISYRSVKPLAGLLARAVGGGGHDQAAGSSLIERSVLKQKIKELL